jgi:hypothetical protein
VAEPVIGGRVRHGVLFGWWGGQADRAALMRRAAASAGASQCADSSISCSPRWRVTASTVSAVLRSRCAKQASRSG